MAKAQIRTPITKDPNGETRVEEIPLPPEAMWGALDNSGSSEATQVASTATAASSASLGGVGLMPAPAKREIAQLDFNGSKKPFQVVPLDYHFELDGEQVTEVTVRRFSIGEVANVIDSMSPQGTDYFEIYAAMTGLPAPVLRGLADTDGERVTGVCYDFLPRLLQAQNKDSGSK